MRDSTVLSQSIDAMPGCINGLAVIQFLLHSDCSECAEQGYSAAAGGFGDILATFWRRMYLARMSRLVSKSLSNLE